MVKTKDKRQQSKEQSKNSVEEYKTWLYLTFKKILGVMYIDFIKLALEFKNEDCNAVPEVPGPGVVFSIKYQPEYHSVQIAVFPLAYQIYCQNKNNLVDAMVHEVSHIHTMPLVNVAEDRYTTKDELRRTCENLTEVLSRYISEFIKLTNKDIYS